LHKHKFIFVLYIYFVLYFFRNFWRNIRLSYPFPFSAQSRQNRLLIFQIPLLYNILGLYSNAKKIGRSEVVENGGNIFGRKLHVHLTRKLNGDIMGETRWGEIPGESTIMSMESTGAKDIRVLEE